MGDFGTDAAPVMRLPFNEGNGSTTTESVTGTVISTNGSTWAFALATGAEPVSVALDVAAGVIPSAS